MTEHKCTFILFRYNTSTGERKDPENFEMRTQGL